LTPAARSGRKSTRSHAGYEAEARHPGVHFMFSEKKLLEYFFGWPMHFIFKVNAMLINLN
jgi:hypothetical protein